MTKIAIQGDVTVWLTFDTETHTIDSLEIHTDEGNFRFNEDNAWDASTWEEMIPKETAAAVIAEIDALETWPDPVSVR